MGILSSIKENTSSLTSVIDKGKDLVGQGQEIFESGQGIVEQSKSFASDTQNSLSVITDKNSSLGDKLSSAKNILNGAKTEIDGVKGVVNSVKDGILQNLPISSEKIDKITNVSSVLSSNLGGVMDGLSKIEGLSSKFDEYSSKLSSAKNLVSGLKSKLSGLKKNKTDSNPTNEEPELTEKDYIAYDENGLKHFMNVFLDTLKSENISFELLGTRRWAVTTEDEKVFGNAFLCQQGTEVYKSLDSDGKYYWMSDYNSRHYYGEAVDITGNLSEILESIAINDNVLDVMHTFGICLQYETSQSGFSKGTHFHCSTDADNPQTKWWGIVNQIREKYNLKFYTVIASSPFYEKETTNAIQIA